jgi:hypothetical protein
MIRLLLSIGDFRARSCTAGNEQLPLFQEQAYGRLHKPAFV